MSRSNRHIPRICRTCGSPQGGNESVCWNCGTRWVPADAAHVDAGAAPKPHQPERVA